MKKHNVPIISINMFEKRIGSYRIVNDHNMGWSFK